VIPQLIKKFYDAKVTGSGHIEIQGTGNETRAFCYISDFIDGLIKVFNSKKSNQTYNIGTSEEITINYLCTTINEILGENLKIIPTPVLEGSPIRRCPNLEKISLLGYQPKIGIKEGLNLMIPWYLKKFKEIYR
jgi:UDP-glucose 4-epimerase